MAPHFCHIMSSFDPGGFELRTVGLMNAFGRRLRHTVIATNGGYGAADRVNQDVPLEVVAPPAGKGNLTYALALARVIRRIQPDLVLTYNWGAIDGVLAAVATRSCPVLHAEDGFGPEEAHGLKRRRVAARRVLLRFAHATIVPSRVLMRIALERFALPPEKVVYIPNGVDTTRFHSRHDRSWRLRAGIADDVLLCGSVGRLRPEKNFAALIDALTHVPDRVHLAIAGDGPERGDLERRVHTLGLGRRVTFAGSLQDPASFYRSLDLFVMSSITEQMPVALLEAMASELAVLATDVGDIRDILGEGATDATVVPSGDASGYARALTALAQDAALRTRLAALNRARVLAEFTLPQMIERYHRVYEAALGTRLPAAP